MKSKIQLREKNSGRYIFEPGRPCVCGHVNHTADRRGGIQPCIGADFGECENPCECMSYKPARK